MSITVDDAIDRLECMQGPWTKPKQAEALAMGADALRRLKEIERWNDHPLSQRLRDGIECAQWVIDAVVKLEQALAATLCPTNESEKD